MWGARKDNLLKVLTENPLAKYVIHSVSFGSEPLFSWNISDTYAKEFTALKAKLKALGYPITVSEVWIYLMPPAFLMAVLTTPAHSR